jgi:hypothetical protein
MANKIICTCGHSWDKSDSSKKDATVCHICGKNNMKDGGWLDKYTPQAQKGKKVNIDGKEYNTDSDEYKELYRWGPNDDGKGGIGYFDKDGVLVTNHTTLPEVVISKKDKDTKAFYDELSESDRYAFDQMTKKYGPVNITSNEGKGLFSGTSGHYNPFSNTITINESSENNPKDTYIAELSHKVQFDKQGKFDVIGDWIFNDLPDYIMGNKPYGDSSTMEYEAHSKIQPTLRDEFYNYSSDDMMGYNYNKFKSGGWLDNYGEEANANEGYSSAPENWVGEGYSNVGRNYSPAWGGQFQNGGTRPSFDEWYKTVPKEKNDTSSYNLRRAYDLAPQEQLNDFAKDPNAHLVSVYENPQTGIYEFMKSKHHPTIQKELDWFNSKDPEAVQFRKNYTLDKSGDYYKYVPKHAMGGSIPGAVGFTYARTNSPAPSNGPYAKKTKASAQDGKNLHPIDLHLPIYEKPKPSLNPYAFYEHPQQDVHIAGIGAHAQGDINNRLNLSGGLHSTSVSYPGGEKMFMKPEYHVGMKYRFDNGGSMSYYQHGLDWKPKSMEEGGWLDKYEVPKNQNAEFTLPRFDMPRAASESTSRVFHDPITGKQESTSTTGQKKEDVKAATEAMRKGREAERKQKEAKKAERKSARDFNEGKTKTFTLPTGESKTLDQMDAREKMYVAGKSLEGKGSIGNEDSFFNEYLNPVTMVTNMAGALGESPYEAKQSNSNMPYVSAIASPLIGGALGFDPLGSAIKVPGKIAQSMESGLLSNTYKINPFAENLNTPFKSYRVAGMDAARDFKNTGVLRSVTPPTPEGATLLERAQNRPTSFPSFQKGYADMRYLPEEGGVVFETGLPTYKRGEINPVTGNTIRGRHYAHRVIDPNTGKTLSEIPGENIRMFGDKPHWLKGYKEVPKPTSISSSVENIVQSTNQPWAAQELPGLHLKSTMSDGAISKIVEPKTGLVNVDQALAIIEKESGGKQKADLVRQALGENIPKKMDFNQFRKTVQDKLVNLNVEVFGKPLPKTKLTQLKEKIFPSKTKERPFTADYRIENLGWVKDNPAANSNNLWFSKASLENTLKRTDKTILDKTEEIKKIEDLLETTTDSNKLNELNDKLVKLKQDNNHSTIYRNHLLYKLENDVNPESKTILFSNRDEFGVGSSTHRNFQETLGHSHYYTDKLDPGSAYITQIQSDPFQLYNWKMPQVEPHLRMKAGWQQQYASTIPFDPTKLTKETTIDHIKQMEESLKSKNAYLKNNRSGWTGQKFNKFEKQRLQKERNELEEYIKLRNNDLKNWDQKELLGKNFNERYFQELLNHFGKSEENISKIKLPSIETLERQQNWEKFDDAQKQTILKGYKNLYKFIEKNYDNKLQKTYDRLGNSWQEFEIPKSFKEGKGEIIAFKEGGVIGDPNQPYHPITNPEGYKVKISDVLKVAQKRAQEASDTRPQIKQGHKELPYEKRATEQRLREQAQANSELAQTMGSFTPQRFEDYTASGGAGSIGAFTQLGATAIPVVAGAVGAAAPIVGAAMETPIAGVAGLTGSNLLNAGFAYQGAKNLPNVASAWKDVANKPTWGGLGNAVSETAVTGLDMFPFLHGAAKGIPSVMQDVNQVGNWLNKGYNNVAESILNSSVENVGSKLKSQTAGTDYIWNHVNKNIKGNLPEGLTKQHVADILENNLSWIESPEYLKRRMATTGESIEQVTKNVQALKKRFKNTKIEFTNKGLGKNSDGIYSGNPSNLISNIRKDVIKIKPDQSLEEIMATIDHEVGHALSPAIKNEKLYKNYPFLPTTSGDNLRNLSNEQGFFNKLLKGNRSKDYVYLEDPAEQQVRFNRLNSKIREDLNLPRNEGTLTDEQFDQWTDTQLKDKFKSFENSGYEDVTDLLRNRSTNVDRSKILKTLNKAWGVVPAVTVASALQQKKQGGVIEDDGNTKKNYSFGKSGIEGKGTFAKQNIQPGDYIGKVHTINQLFTDYDFTDLGKNHNHSDDPNVKNVLIGNERHLVAIKPINKGTELTSNYRLQPDLEQPESFKKKGGWLEKYN